MKRFYHMIAALGLVAAFHGSASAQVPPPPSNGGLLQAMFNSGPVAQPYAVPVYGMPAPSHEKTSNRYGFHPILKRLFHIKDGCNNCMPPMQNPAMGGTLAFPNHPYARSPRDFFDGNR